MDSNNDESLVDIMLMILTLIIGLSLTALFGDEYPEATATIMCMVFLLAMMVATITVCILERVINEHSNKRR